MEGGTKSLKAKRMGIHKNNFSIIETRTARVDLGANKRRDREIDFGRGRAVSLSTSKLNHYQRQAEAMAFFLPDIRTDISPPTQHQRICSRCGSVSS